MSRTTRKRIKSFELYHERQFPGGFSHRLINNDKAIEQAKARYYGRTEKWYSWKLPKAYRKSVNRQRRSIDRMALYQEMTQDDVAGDFCRWNCKSSVAWGYW